MKGFKQKFKRPASNSPLPKDAAWTHQDQRVWQAVAGNHPAKVAAKLTKHPDVDVNRICPNVGYSVVHYAAAKGLDDCLNILLAHRADAAACDITGATPLHAAARYGHKGTTSKLLASRSIDVNRSDNNQCTALHFAAFEGHVECVKLIAGVADVNLDCTDKDGRTPLMVASAMGRADVCKALVERGCNIHHRDVKLGHTALTLAADSGHASVVRLLCENGANHEETLVDGRTALHLAKQKDRRSVIDALHVVQLTEAANKAGTGGPRLSVSSNGYRPVDAATKRHSCDGILDSVHQTYIDDLVAGTHLSSGSRTPKPLRRTKEEKKQGRSNISRVKAAVGAKIKSSSPHRDSDGSGKSGTSTPRQKGKKDIAPGSTALPLYGEAGSNFYEKELKFYDSNSSLDVSSTCSAMMTNVSKSMDSLRPTPEEVEDSPSAAKPAAKGGADPTKKLVDVAAVTRLEKMSEDQQKRISHLEEALRKSQENNVAKEKLQQSARDAHSSQIAALKEDYETKESRRMAEFEQMKQLSVEFKRQNEDLLKRLSNHQNLAGILNSTKEQLRKQEETNTNLREENKVLLEKIDEMENQNDALKEEVANGKKSESSIIAQAKEKIIEAERRCNLAEQRSRDWELKCEEERARTEESENLRQESNRKVADAEKRCADLGRIRNNLEEAYAGRERELALASEQRAEIEEKLADAAKSQRTAERELKKLKESRTKDQVTLSAYKDELESVSTLLKEAGLKSEGSTLSVRQDVVSLLKTLKVEEENAAQTNSQKKDLQDKLHTSIDAKNRTIEDLEEKLKAGEDALHRKVAECSRLDSELRHAKLSLTTVEDEKKKLEEDLSSEVKEMREELIKYQMMHQIEDSGLSRSKSELDDLRQQLADAFAEIERMREDSIPRDVYEADCVRIKKDADALKKEVAKTLERFAMLQLELASKEQELSDMRVARNQSEARSIKLENEASQLRAGCRESDIQVNVLRQQLTETKQKLGKAADEVESLRTSRRDMTLRLAAKHSELNEGERKNVENLKSQIENLSRHLQESEKRQRETVAIYRGHLLAAITGQLDEDVQQALQEIIKLRGKDDDKLLQLASHAAT